MSAFESLPHFITLITIRKDNIPVATFEPQQGIPLWDQAQTALELYQSPIQGSA